MSKLFPGLLECYSTLAESNDATNRSCSDNLIKKLGFTAP
jgi:hypothetical protein